MQNEKMEATVSPTSTVVKPQYTLDDFKHNSTIYRRNQKRMLNSYNKRGDTRIAPIRVLSGLPGFNLLFEPYDPSKYDGNNILLENLDTHQSGTTSSITQYSYAFLSGCAGGTLEAVFGRSSTDVIRRVSGQVNLLFSTPGRTAIIEPTPFLHSNSNTMGLSQANIQTSSSHVELSSSSNKLNTRILNERIIASACAGGLLFSSNYYFRSKFFPSEDHRETLRKDGNLALTTPFISASIATGVVTGTVFAPLEFVRSRILRRLNSVSASPFLRGSQLCSNSLAFESFLNESVHIFKKHGIASLFKGGSEVYAREIIGNVLYFSTYELMKSSLVTLTNPEDHKPTSTPTIAGSGAFAGVAYWAVIYPIDTLKSMLQAQSITNPRFHTAISAVKEVGFFNLYRGYFSCVLRAAPANAALFVGYEKAMEIFSTVK